MVPALEAAAFCVLYSSLSLSLELTCETGVVGVVTCVGVVGAGVSVGAIVVTVGVGVGVARPSSLSSSLLSPLSRSILLIEVLGVKGFREARKPRGFFLMPVAGVGVGVGEEAEVEVELAAAAPSAPDE